MMQELQMCLVAMAVLLPIAAVLARLAVVLPAAGRKNQVSPKIPPAGQISPHLPPGGHIMALLGSGGHTGEMLRLLAPLDLSGFQKTWLVSAGDSTSLEKAKAYENSQQNLPKSSVYVTLARARKVGQPLWSSVFSTLHSLWSVAVALTTMEKPDVLVLNGPGTCVPVAYWLFLLRFCGLASTRIVYVESLARVNQLSLSGLLVLPIADRILVQWESLAQRYARTEYYGILI